MQNEPTPDHLAYAGFWVRFAAFVIDSVLVVAVTLPILYAVYGDEYFSVESAMKGPVDLRVSWVLPAVAVVMFWVYRSATPGKMVLSTCIVDARTGAQPSARQCIVRYLGYYVSIFGCGLGFLWIAFDPRKQGWHDKLAGTVVVYA